MIDRFLVIVQALVTLALLGFAYVMRDESRTLADVVVTAAIWHWLDAAGSARRAARTRRRSEVT